MMNLSGQSPPGNRKLKPDDWLTNPGNMTTVMSLTFVVLFSVAFFLGYQHMETAKRHALVSDVTTANLLAGILREHELATINILRSYSNRPLFIEAVRRKDIPKTRWHLAELKKHHEIDLTFVTDPKGILWLNYPYFPEALRKNLSYRDWYKGVSAHWKPYASEVFQLIVADRPLALAIALPVKDSKGMIVGILANSQRLTFLADTIEQIPFSPNTAITIVDRSEQILYSNGYPYRQSIQTYPHSSMFTQAGKEKAQQVEDPHHADQGRLFLSIAPIHELGWNVIVERRMKDIYRAEYRRLAEIGGAALLTFVLIGVGLAYLRRYSLYRRAEELLASQQETLEQQRRYQSLLNSIHMIAIGLDEEGRITFANPYFLQLTGYSCDEALGNDWFERFLPEEDRQNVRRVFLSLKDDEPVSHHENRILTRSGKERIIAWNNTVLNDHQGRFAGTMSLGVDVTDVRQVVERLRESEERYRGLFENALEGIYQSTVEGRYISANPAMAKIYGYDSPEEMIHSVTDISNQIYVRPEDREHCLAILDRGGELRGVEVEERRKDGTTIWVSLHAKAIRDDTGRIVRLEGMAVDVTDYRKTVEALRENQRFLTDLIENSGALIFVKDRQGRYILVNSKWEEVTGIGREKTLGRTDEELFPSPVGSQFRRNDLLVMASGTLQEAEEILDDPSGRRVFHSIKFPMKDEEGAITGICGMSTEITQRKRVEEEILRLNEELEQRVRERTVQVEAANRELEAFAYSVSHDLRAPLRSIDGFSQALLEDYQEAIDERGRDYLGRVRQAAQRMGFLIDDILKLSRISQAELKREAVDLSRMIREITDGYQSAEPGRAVEVVIREGIVVMADPYLLRIALMNLLDNAWKFTGKTTYPRIEFGADIIEREILCFIRDNGAGFDMAYVGKLFGAFQRLHLMEEFPGTGIGLATVQRIMHRHGGRVWAEGKVGEGASFYFTLPILMAGHEDEHS